MHDTFVSPTLATWILNRERFVFTFKKVQVLFAVITLIGDVHIRVGGAEQSCPLARTSPYASSQ